MRTRDTHIIGGPKRFPVYADEFDKALVVMNEIHHNIHRGIFFSATHVALAIADDADVNILVVVTTAMHVRSAVSIQGQALISFFEGTTVSAAGTAVTACNRNRFSALVATSVITHTPTITGDGTLLAQSYIPGGTGGNSVGSNKSSFEEWLLNPGTYMLRLTNTSGNASDVSVALDFYEPDLDA